MAYGVDGRLYVATTGGVLSTDAVQSDPVSWRRAKGMEGVTFFTVSPDPTDSDQFWAGTWGNDIGVSNDGGATIARLGAGLETLSVLAILRHPTPGQFTIGTIEGLFRSDDGGASWFALPGALSQQTVYALLQGDDGVLWAGAADGLWRSDDYGVTWRRSNALADVTVIRLGRASLPNGELLWAGSEDDGFWWSRDHGASWRFGGLSGRSVYALTAVGEQLIAATDRGLAAITAQQLLTAP
jgi:ligand-binding sensor domain-containing protein